MVQFSLKLEDNRVDKWSSQYLDYRKLKKAIKQLALARRTAAIVAQRYIIQLCIIVHTKSTAVVLLLYVCIHT